MTDSETPMHTIEPLTYLVDSDGAALKDMTRLLKAAGLQVAAFDRTEAFLRAHDPAVPGCAVIDVRMPGLDGVALLSELRQAGTERAIVFVTGGGDVALGVRPRLELLVEDRALLAPGAAHDEHLGAEAAVVGVGRRALAGLVVGMGVDGQEAQGHGFLAIRAGQTLLPS